MQPFDSLTKVRKLLFELLRRGSKYAAALLAGGPGRSKAQEFLDILEKKFAIALKSKLYSLDKNLNQGFSFDKGQNFKLRTF